MGRFLAWRQRRLAEAVRRYSADPWGYSVRGSLYLATAVVLGALIGGASAVDAAAQGLVAGLLLLPLMRFVLGPHWSRRSGA